MQKIKFNSLEDLKKEGKSFYWGSFFLPRKLRNNVATLYSICRYFDNIADHDDKDRSAQLKKLIPLYEAISGTRESFVMPG